MLVIVPRRSGLGAYRGWMGTVFFDVRCLSRHPTSKETSIMRQNLKQALALIFFGVLPCLALAQPIVDHAQLQEAVKRGAQVWDVRDARDFAKGH